MLTSVVALCTDPERVPPVATDHAGDGQALDSRTVAAQALHGLDGVAGTSATVPAIDLAVTFEREAGATTGRVYGRCDNPTFQIAEAVIAKLECGNEALLFSSGMAAAAAAIFSMPPGSRIVAPNTMYSGLKRWLTTWVQDAGYLVEFLDFRNLHLVRQHCDDAKPQMIWAESPTTPMLEVVDLAGLAAISKEAGAWLLVDNTSATPVSTRPLQLGADMVLHSATKSLNGHSDVIAGVLVCRAGSNWWTRIKDYRNANGAIVGPFEAWLLIRGMRTLFLRQEASNASAAQIANSLLGHPQIAEVIYPGLTCHPQHSLARRQMGEEFGSQLSIRFKLGEAMALATLRELRTWTSATSFGCVQSMAEHRASIEEGWGGTPPDLLRLSVGIESTRDLVDDLLRAICTAAAEIQP